MATKSDGPNDADCKLQRRWYIEGIKCPDQVVGDHGRYVAESERKAISIQSAEPGPNDPLASKETVVGCDQEGITQ